MPIAFETLWSEKYAALHAAAEAEETDRRAEDFLDVSRTVCGLPLRAMTPRDWLTLGYVQSPFVVGGEIKAAHVPQFLCALHAEPPQGWLSNRRFFKHVAALPRVAAADEIHGYVARIFADGPRGGGGQGRPLGTHFVAPLIVRIAAGIPGLTPAAVMDTPLPQLFQFQKVIAAEEAKRSGGKYREITAYDRLLADCMAEFNQINSQPVGSPLAADQSVA